MFIEDEKELIKEINNGNVSYRNKKGFLHRLDGPAIEYAGGQKEYWINGIKYSKKEYWINGIKYSKKDYVLTIKENFKT